MFQFKKIPTKWSRQSRRDEMFVAQRPPHKIDEPRRGEMFNLFQHFNPTDFLIFFLCEAINITSLWLLILARRKFCAKIW